MTFSRADRSLLSDWWFSIDRMLLTLVIVLMIAGLVVSLAASPPAAHRLGLSPFHFVIRHALFLCLSLPLFFAVSMLTPRQIRWLALALLAGGLLLMVLALVQGIERNGALRWLSLGGFSLQPSEFVKPGFVVVAAWLLAEGMRRSDVPALPLAALLLGIFAALLMAQPDVGQTLLATIVWGSLFFLAGYALKYVAVLGGLLTAGLGLAYLTVDHVHHRIDQYLTPSAAGNRQSDIAFSAFIEGGWWGRGPGEGTLKMHLPDAHTDYVFAVVAEEFGIISCLFIALLYALMAWRGMIVRSGETNDFENLAKTGLTVLLVVQALTNMAVNINLIPAKGVTLPFISYGGSSLLSVAITLGMMLALSRRRATARASAWTAMFGAKARSVSSREMQV